MITLFRMGGPLFMGILTGLFVFILFLSVYYLVLIVRKDYKDLDNIRKQLTYIKASGLLSLVSGILGQLIGLYTAFSAIEQSPDISPAMMFGGLKISMITTLYGIVIFLVSYLFWGAIDYIASRQQEG